MDHRSVSLIAEDESVGPGRKIIMHPLYLPKSSPWLDLKVYYVRVSNCEVDKSTPDRLTLNHVPLTPDTIIEVNGRRSSIYSDWVSSTLRRDRVDKRSEEATYVSTDSIRISGSVRFEVFDKEDPLLSGVLELSNGNGYTGDSKGHSKKWSMRCQSVVSGATSFLKGKQCLSPELAPPTVEVYVAGCFSGTPIILTKTLQLVLRKKCQKKMMLDSIPENETTEKEKEAYSGDLLQLSENQRYKSEADMDSDYASFYSRAEYMEGDDGELSWFNAGVRVGVGIGLGICLGVGVGVGLLVRTYQSTTKNFRRRII